MADLIHMLKSCGATFDEYLKYFDKITNAIPRPTEDTILLISRNPNLSWWQKWKFKRQITRIVAKNKKGGSNNAGNLLRGMQMLRKAANNGRSSNGQRK